MKIGFDLTPILYHRGVSRYTSNLFAALSQLPDCELFPYASSGRGFSQLQQDLQALAQTLDKKQQGIFWQNLVCQKIPPKLTELTWHYLQLNPIKKQLPHIDIFHSWDYLQPPDKNLPLVSTIHDLAILKYPEVANPEILRHHQRSWQILRQRRAHIIAVSQATKNDVVNLLHFPADHVHLVYEALPQENLLDQKTLQNQDISVIRRKFSLTDLPYFLFVGTREPRKNLDRLIQAWWDLREQAQLVLVGAPGWHEPKYQHPNLHVLPAITNHELGLLYHFAQALTYPSLDEGFGLPILEAFYYQTPVITSGSGATAEVAGAAAILVDPHDISVIRRGLEQALALTPTQLTALRQKMTAQLNTFSWHQAALQTYQVYQQALEDFHHA